MSGAERGNRTPDARAFNAPLYLLSYLGKQIWRLVRESNPRLPTRQAGTLATELTRLVSIRSRVPAPPNRCGRFPPRSVSSTRVPCAGVACGIRTRVSTLKEWCPRPSRRTRPVWWCLRRQMLCLLIDEGDGDPLRLCPNASIPSDVVSRCTWLRPWVAHIPRRQHHVARQRSERTHPK